MKYPLGYHSAALLCIALVLGSIVVSHMRTSSLKVPVFALYTNEGFREAGAFWKGEIARAGGKKAYTEFLRTYASSTPGDQHTMAHIFGGSLYAQEGVAGLSACDDSFAYGCFHEFLGRAIQQEGLTIVGTLNEACFKALGPGKALSCTHGLGHGIESYLGYTDDALIQSLDVCKKLANSDPIGGCPGGVFMEFNMRTMHSFSGMPPRSVEPEGLQYPCSIFTGGDAEVCYYWQPQWWYQTFKSEGKSSRDIVARIGALCSGTAMSVHTKCFQGVGTIVAMAADYDVAETIRLCTLASARNDERSPCRVTAADSFFAEVSARSRARGLCVGLVEPWYTMCGKAASGRSEVPPAGRD
ncbi:MAG: hypothetical protein WCK46_00315 [Candidatus Adlerbacteria bacterium]